MFTKKVPVIYLIFSAIFVSAITFIVINFAYQAEKQDHNTGLGQHAVADADYNIQRDQTNYKYISPIISFEPNNEAEKYTAIKAEMEEFINKEKANGSIFSASVYLRDFSKGEWMAINPAEAYNPGSLLKVGVLITYLQMAEKNPKLPEMEVVYRAEKGFVFPVEHYTNDTVVEGHKYKIKDLLQYMIKYSDNRATVFLEDHMDTAIFKKEFSDLGITEPRFNDPTYALNVKEYSMLLKALYNAGYLHKQASENALALLAESTFKDGLLKGLPDNVVVAHKFGETGDRTLHELHESGIIYLRNNPYLVTIMTKGSDWNKLSETIGNISRMAYEKMNLSTDAEYHASASK